MEQVFVKDLLDATKGTLLCGKEDLPVERICINSKEAQVGDLFVPCSSFPEDGPGGRSQCLFDQ